MRNLNDDKNKREQILTDGEQKQRFGEGLHKFPQNITTGNPAQNRMAIDQSVLAKRGRDAARILGVEHLNASELDDFLFHDQHDFLSAVPERNARGVYVPRTQDERRFVAFNELARLQLAAKGGGKGLSGASVYAPREEEDAGKALLAELTEKGWPFAGIASRSKTPTEDDAAPQPMPLRAPDPQDVRTPEAPADDMPPRPMPLGTPSPVATPAPTDTPDPTEQQENAEEQEATTGKGSTSASEKKDKLIANLELFLGRKLTTEEMENINTNSHKLTLPEATLSTSYMPIKELRKTSSADSTLTKALGQLPSKAPIYDSNRKNYLTDIENQRIGEIKKKPTQFFSALYATGEETKGSIVTIPFTSETLPMIDDLKLLLLSAGYAVPQENQYDHLEMCQQQNGYTFCFVGGKVPLTPETIGVKEPRDDYVYSITLKEKKTDIKAGDLVDASTGVVGSLVSILLQIMQGYYITPGDTAFTAGLSDALTGLSFSNALPRGSNWITELRFEGAQRNSYSWNYLLGEPYKNDLASIQHGSIIPMIP